MSEDPSNGYDAVAEDFMAVRSASGRALIETWAASLPRGASVIDVGAGSGEPLTAALIDAGLAVSAIDAAPKMVAAFRRRFPGVEVACEPAERSRFFGRTFDAALMVGLIFLLPPDRQPVLISRLADALKPDGRVLFSAPRERGTWDDMLTGLPSHALGAEAYRTLLSESGLSLVDTHTDDGGSHYYEARKQRT